MTVKELIEQLKEMPENAKVMIYSEMYAEDSVPSKAKSTDYDEEENEAWITGSDGMYL